MRAQTTVPVVLYAPEAEKQQELEEKAAEVYAGLIADRIQKLDCAVEQKLQLLQHVVKRIKEM